MTRDTRAASFRIETQTWLDFVEKAKSNNTDSSKLLRDWIESYLSDSVINNQTTVDGLSDRVTQVVDSNVIKDITTVRQDVDSVTQNITTVRQDVDSVTQNITTVRQDVDSVTQNITTVRQDVDTLSDKITQVVDSVTQDKETIKELVERLTELEKKLATY
jgi:chromosome segregation ATPase